MIILKHFFVIKHDKIKYIKSILWNKIFKNIRNTNSNIKFISKFEIIIQTIYNNETMVNIKKKNCYNNMSKVIFLFLKYFFI